jgi:hypothetical protein
MISSTGVPPIANIKEILLAKSWSKMSQNQFKLVYSVWISDGQNYVFFTTFAKPKVVVYGSCTCPSFARVPVLCFFMLSSTGVPPIANINSNVSKHVLKYMHFHAQFDRCPPKSQHQGNLTGQILVKNITKSI